MLVWYNSYLEMSEPRWCLTTIVFNFAWDVKVKLSLYRLRSTLRARAGWGSQDFWESTKESGHVVSSTHQLHILLRAIAGTHFCWRLSQPQDHIAARRIRSMQNLKDQTGNQPMTFQLVAQCLNQLWHYVPLALYVSLPKFNKTRRDWEWVGYINCWFYLGYM